MSVLPLMVACATAADALSHVPGHADEAVVLVIGLEYWDTGEYTLRVAGDGTITLKNRNAGKQQEWSTHWDETHVKLFIDNLRNNGFLSISPPTGPRKPGDVPLIFRVEGSMPYEVRLYEGDRYTLPNVDRIVSQLDALIQELSAQKYLQPSP